VLQLFEHPKHDSAIPLSIRHYEALVEFSNHGAVQKEMPQLLW
jgi:hypothetical protein